MMNSNDRGNAYNDTERSPLLRPSSPSASVTTLTGSEGVETRRDRIRASLTTGRICCLVAAFAITVFLQTSNFTLMTTTAGPIADDLNAYAQVSWFTSAFLIGNSCMTPLYGRFAQIFSPRACALVTGIIYSIGCIITSQAGSLSVFLLGRSIAGIGAGIWVLGTIIILDLTNESQRGLFIGLINASVTGGVVFGAVVGGALVEPIGWRALFWPQGPLSFAAAIVLYLAIPKEPTDGDASENRQSIGAKIWAIDYAGILLLVAGVTSCLIGVASPTVLFTPIIVGFVLLAAFVANELYRAQDPVIPISVLKSRGVLLSCIGQIFLMICRWAILFYAPVYALAVRLWSPSAAGTVLLPTNIGFALGGLITGALHIRNGGSFYKSTLACYVAFPIALLAVSLLATAAAPSWPIFIALFVNGFSIGASFNYGLAHMLFLTLPDAHFVATSLLTTVRVFSGTLGASIGGGLFSRLLQANLKSGFADKGVTGKDELITQLLGKPGLVAMLDGVERVVARQSYQDALQNLFLAGCGLSILALCIQAGTGWTAPVEEQAKQYDEEESGY